jgi:hypothetical protein
MSLANLLYQSDWNLPGHSNVTLASQLAPSQKPNIPIHTNNLPEEGKGQGHNLGSYGEYLVGQTRSPFSTTSRDGLHDFIKTVPTSVLNEALDEGVAVTEVMADSVDDESLWPVHSHSAAGGNIVGHVQVLPVRPIRTKTLIRQWAQEFHDLFL